MDTINLQKGNELLQFFYEDGTTVVIYAWQAIVILCVCAAVAVALYVLMGLGLMKMAANNGVKLGWLGFVPFARYFIAGRVAGHTRLFGKKMKNAGFWLMILAAVLFVLNALNQYFSYYPIAYKFFEGETVIFTPDPSGFGWVTNINFVYAPAVSVYMNISQYFILLLDLAYYFFFIMLFMQLFKKFNPRNYFTFTLLSFFGELLGISLAGAFVFSQRNRKAVNYNDYLKEQYMRMQGMYFPRGKIRRIIPSASSAGGGITTRAIPSPNTAKKNPRRNCRRAERKAIRITKAVRTTKTTRRRRTIPPSTGSERKKQSGAPCFSCVEGALLRRKRDEKRYDLRAVHPRGRGGRGGHPR